jgi:hypothetical protein
MSTTYSFKDLSGTVTCPGIIAVPFSFFGQIGIGSATVTMATDKTAQDVASDGAIMVSAIPGDNGHIAFEMQQTSALYAFFLSTYNALKTAMLNGDVTSWAGMSITLRNIVDGSTHVCTGVSFNKIPDKVYAAQGQRQTWTLPCADIQQTQLGL